ncbi:MAG: hypothetical protein KGL63_11530 [Betaproteobacteria bacterium]|nr:hypothetical protein [Betaproteobacteria bacterium]
MHLLCLDWETFYSSDYSLSKLTTEEYIRSPQFRAHGAAVALDGASPHWVSHDDLPTYLAQIDWPNTALLCHNTAFDGAILAWHYGHIPALYLDTLSMARVGLPNRPPARSVSLENLAKIYGLPAKGAALALSKGIRELPPDIERQIAAYACQDAHITRLLFDKLKQGFPPDELRLIDLTLRMFTRPLLTIDQPMLWESLDRIRSSKESLLAQCGLTREDCNSSAKFAAALESVGVTVEYKPGKKGPVPALAKTDAFMQALLEDDDPVVQALAAARLGVKSTIDETRTERFLSVASRGPLPVPLKYYGAHTGRWSGEGGLNMQNLRRKSPLRECLQAPEGYAVIVADSAQIEARILAWVAGHKTLVEDFRNKVDIYSAMGEQVGASRSVGKVLILALGFGQGHKNLRETLRRGPMGMPPIIVDEATAQHWVQGYRHIHAPIPALWRQLESKLPVIAEKGLTLPNGAALHYPDLKQNADGWSYQGRRERISLWGGSLTENYMQALARIVVAGQMIEIARRYPVVTMTHDEVVAVAPIDEADDALQFMLDLMRTEPDWCKGLPLNAEGGWATNYSK